MVVAVSFRGRKKSRHPQPVIGGTCGVQHLQVLLAFTFWLRLNLQPSAAQVLHRDPRHNAPMPIPLLAEGLGRGLTGIPYLWTVVQGALAIGFISVLKLYFGGAKCRSERVMHGKVVMVTV